MSGFDVEGAAEQGLDPVENSLENVVPALNCTVSRQTRALADDFVQLRFNDDRVVVKGALPRADEALFVLDDVQCPAERADNKVLGCHTALDDQEGRGGDSS